MIPYTRMTFSDYNFYWGESILFTQLEGKWTPVRPVNHTEDGYMQNEGMLLERIGAHGGKLQFITLDSVTHVEVPPMNLFESDDWITYEPALGYFILRGQLGLITSNVPQSRHKGLHNARLSCMSPLGEATLPSHVDVVTGSGYSICIITLANAIADRLNTPFSSSWYTTINTGMSADQPLILDAKTCVIPTPQTGGACLFFQGTLIGQIKKKAALLEFHPENKPTTNLELAINSYIRTRLLTPPDTEENING